MAVGLTSLFDDLVLDPAPARRWSQLTRTLADLGVTEINYAFLDMATAGRMDCRGDPVMSTMRPDWLQYYVEHLYDMNDYAVSHVRSGRIDPMIWSLDDAKTTAAGRTATPCAAASARHPAGPWRQRRAVGRIGRGQHLAGRAGRRLDGVSGGAAGLAGLDVQIGDLFRSEPAQRVPGVGTPRRRCTSASSHFQSVSLW